MAPLEVISRQTPRPVDITPTEGQAEPAAAQTKPPWLTLTRKKLIELWMFVVPLGIFFIALFIYPVVFGSYMSVTDYGTRAFITGEAPFVGLENYSTVMNSARASQAFVNTIVLTVVAVALQAVIGLGIALLFSRKFPGASWLPTLMLIPWLIPPVVVATTWRWLLQNDGAVNQILRSMGLPGHPWISDTSTAMAALIAVTVWGSLPFWVVILTAALKQVPKEQLEAAQLDGANGWKRLLHVIMPTIAPVMFVLVILGVIYALKIVDLVLVLTGGGPADATLTLGLLAYQASFEVFDFGTSAAYGMVLLVLCLITAFFYARLSARQEEGQY